MAQAEGLRAAARRAPARRCRSSSACATGIRFSPTRSREMSRAGVRRAVGFIAAAHRSYSSCTQYRENVADARARARARRAAPTSRSPTSPTGTTHPLFIEANADACRAALAALEPALRDRAQLVFTAHSIPESMAARYPYRGSSRRRARLVAGRGCRRGVAVRDRLSEPQRPARGSVARTRRLRLPARGARERTRGRGALSRSASSAITSRCSTTSTSKPPRSAREIGLPMVRAQAVNDHPRFLDMMADVVLRRLPPLRACAAARTGAAPYDDAVAAIGGRRRWSSRGLAIAQCWPARRRQTSPSRGLTAVQGLKVGHHTLTERPTGCTVVLAEQGATAGVDVRGSAPGTRETDLLAPTATVEQVHAIVLAGGSAFGLDAASGVMRYLEQRGVGFKFGGAVVPIVPAAILFDLGVGDAKIRPTADCGSRRGAGRDRRSGRRRQRRRRRRRDGRQDGGPRARDEGRHRQRRHRAARRPRRRGARRGQRARRRHRSGDRPGRRRHAHRGRQGLGGRAARGCESASSSRRAAEPLQHTTIGVVATNATLTKTQATKVAQMAHDGLARAIVPAHTTGDGDAIFALATGARAGAGRRRHDRRAGGRGDGRGDRPRRARGDRHPRLSRRPRSAVSRHARSCSLVAYSLAHGRASACGSAGACARPATSSWPDARSARRSSSRRFSPATSAPARPSAPRRSPIATA